jgi:hypothetical protein
MPSSTSHLRTIALRTLACGLSLSVLTGCQSLTSEGSFSRIRIVDLAADTPAVDIYHGANAVAYNLSFGTVTSYIPVTPGSSTLTVDVAGSKQVLSLLKGSFSAGMNYTMLVNGPVASLQQVVLADQPQPAVAANPSVRLIHQAAQTGAVDVYLVPAGQRLSATTPLITNLAAGAATAYLPVPSGIFAVVLLPAGTPPTASAAIHSGRQLRYSSGLARTLILVDPSPSSSVGVQVITTTDAEPTN